MAQPRSSTRSNNPNPTDKSPKQPQFADRKGARAHRDDTPEGRLQRQRVPETHPTREPRAMRHDTSGGGAGGSRGGNVATRKTTARGGKTKSAQSRARAHIARSGGTGRAGASAGTSRTLGPRPARARNERGRGDVGPDTRIAT